MSVSLRRASQRKTVTPMTTSPPLRLEAEARQGDAHLDEPALAGPGDGDVPERVPAQVHGHLVRVGIWASRKTAASKRRPAGVVKKASEFSLSLNVSKKTPNQSVVAIIASRFLVGAWILSGSSVEEAAGDVDELVVVAEQGLAPLGAGLAEGRRLHDHAERRDARPAGLAAHAVESDRPLDAADDDALGAGQLEDVLDLDRRGLGGEDRRAREQGDGQHGRPAVIFPEKHAPEDTRINSGTQYHSPISSELGT